MWLSLLLRNWYWVIIFSLTLMLNLSYFHGRHLKSQLETERAEREVMRREAEAYRIQSRQTIERIENDYKTLVESAKKDAYTNYIRKYGKGNAACGISLPGVGVQPAAADGETRSAGEPENLPEQEPVAAQRQFVENCAKDAGVTELWREWCVRNDLGC